MVLRTCRQLNLAKLLEDLSDLLILWHFDMPSSKSKDRVKKLLTILRKTKIKDINDNIDNTFDLDKLYSLDTEREQMLTKDFNDAADSPTAEYQSPLDRSSYNYGYMTIGEIGAGTENAW